MQEEHFGPMQAKSSACTAQAFLSPIASEFEDHRLDLRNSRINKMLYFADSLLWRGGRKAVLG